MKETLAAAAVAPQIDALPRACPYLAAGSLAWRELVRFLRQRNRVFGALGQPIIFWLLFSEGFRNAKGLGYLHFYPGTLVMILLFTAIFSTISIIEDRREGFLQSVLVAPIPRWSMVAGKVFGGAALAMLQGLLFLALGLATLEIRPGVTGIVGTVVLMAVVSIALCGLGFLLAWRMNSTQGFHAVMSVLLLPMWLLSGAFFPAETGVLGWVVRFNPLTYGVSGLRMQMGIPSTGTTDSLQSSLAFCWLASLVFAGVTFALCCAAARRTTRGDLL